MSEVLLVAQTQCVLQVQLLMSMKVLHHGVSTGGLCVANLLQTGRANTFVKQLCIPMILLHVALYTDAKIITRLLDASCAESVAMLITQAIGVQPSR